MVLSSHNDGQASVKVVELALWLVSSHNSCQAREMMLSSHNDGQARAKVFELTQWC